VTPSSPTVSLVIPTYNEAHNIIALLDEVARVLHHESWEAIVVDDASPDNTGPLVTAYSQSHPQVRLLSRTGKRGLSSAVINGFEMAQGQILAVMDGDCSHDVAILPPMIAAVREGYDLVVGSRRVAGGGAEKWPWYRHLTSTLATQLTYGMIGRTLRDPMSGYFCLPRSLFEACKGRLHPEGYKILLEIYCAGRPHKVHEIPFIFKDRVQGHSKLSLQVAMQFLQMLYRLREKNR